MSEQIITITNQNNDYCIILDKNLSLITMTGYIRLPAAEINIRIVPGVNKFISEASETCTVNIENLQYLNSLGISNLMILIMQIYNKNLGLNILCTKKYTWQTKIEDNFKTAHPDAVITYQE